VFQSDNLDKVRFRSAAFAADAPLTWRDPMSRKPPRSSAPSLSTPTRNLTERVRDRVAEIGVEERRALRRVYGELRTTYQTHRRKTGGAPLPALREAVHAFKREPTLDSLVGVAAFLDDRSLLTW
jgi:hypothetical protein